MTVDWTPFRWPVTWTDPSTLSLLRGTPINCLLIDPDVRFDAIRAQARQDGLRTTAPDRVHIVKGEWAGVRRARAGDASSAGPTGVAWVNSNGWAVRLAAALHPDAAIWVQAAPEEKTVVPAASYLITLADTACHGGRWIIELDTAFAAGLARKDAVSLAAWKRLCDSAALFAAHRDWATFPARANIAVLSDFTGEHEFFAGELLNLLARAGGHDRILVKDKVTPAAFQDLRAVLYADAAPASDALRAQLRDYVQAGGLLLAHANWSPAPGAPVNAEDHPRFALYSAGKGRIAVAKDANPDPYEWANDTAVFVSHRYDLVRFWNGGATGSHYTLSPDRKRALVHLMFYADQGPDAASVRVAGSYRAARIWTADSATARPVKLLPQHEAVEVHLPQVPQYVGLELDI